MYIHFIQTIFAIRLEESNKNDEGNVETSSLDYVKRERSCWKLS